MAQTQKMVCISLKCARMPKMIKAIVRTEWAGMMKINLLSLPLINAYWTLKHKTTNHLKIIF